MNSKRNKIQLYVFVEQLFLLHYDLTSIGYQLPDGDMKEQKSLISLKSTKAWNVQGLRNEKIIIEYLPCPIYHVNKVLLKPQICKNFVCPILVLLINFSASIMLVFWFKPISMSEKFW